MSHIPSIGDVYRLFCTQTFPNKNKFLIYMGAAAGNNRCLFLYINSEITSFLQRDPTSRKCFIPISSNDYEFLDHDSFVDCYDANTEFTLNIVPASKLVGSVDNNLLEQAYPIIEVSESLPRWVIREILSFRT